MACDKSKQTENYSQTAQIAYTNRLYNSRPKVRISKKIDPNFRPSDFRRLGKSKSIQTCIIGCQSDVLSQKWLNNEKNQFLVIGLTKK